MNELIQTFNFDADFVRVVVDDTNNPLFVAKDVATVLGYSDTTNAIKQHCKGVAKHHPIADRMVKGRISEYGFAENQYFVVFAKIGEN